jgi:hypothetical protein
LFLHNVQKTTREITITNLDNKAKLCYNLHTLLTEVFIMTVSATNFKKNPSKYLNEVVKTNGVINVQTDAGHVTILNTAEYERQIEEFETIKGIQRGEDDIKAGRFITEEQMSAHMDKKVSELREKGLL